ncbi:MAG: hypothetical protein KAT66_00755 [Candidatus Lokiarchaeota archaeon]|nr:hypothetical protein [Candidatus Lokiarchaeota archaeon]
MKQAYFCAKCKNEKTDVRKAVELSNKLGFKLWIPEKKVSYDFPKGARECQKAMDNSKIIICQTPIGRDCAWELGYAVAQKKPIYVIGKFEKDDWMTKLGNITYAKD